MRIVMSSGHGLHIRGAEGPSPWGLDEVDEARKVTNRSAEALRANGVNVVVFHDDKSTSQDENLDRIISFHNSNERDLDVSVHFNSATFNGSDQTDNPVGCEVFYKSSTGEAVATEVVDAICEASGLINRGPKYSGGLAFLNQTDMPAVLLEICFVNSSADASIYRFKFEEICEAIGLALSDEEAVAPRPPRPEPPEPEFPDGPILPDIPIPPEILPPELPGVPPPEDRRVLKQGDNGPDVAVLQAILGIPADGGFGSVTSAQVEAFQRAHGLSADGVVGPQTWREVDHLAVRMVTGTTGLPAGLSDAVTALAKASPLMFYSWPDRGRSPPGYLPGMALCYALALVQLQEGKPWVDVMAQDAVPGGDDYDALAWYESEFENLGFDLTVPGVECLRALFTLMIGLGMRESSGKYCEGRDMSADNMASDTCEAGLFQMSWNMETAAPEMGELFGEYWDDPNGFLGMFAIDVNPTSANLDVYGSGEGASFQWLAKYSPAFAVMTTAVGLRLRKDHWGPIKRKEVTLSPDAVRLLQAVEMLVALGPAALRRQA
jgi:hypothetical protein